MLYKKKYLGIVFLFFFTLSSCYEEFVDFDPSPTDDLNLPYLLNLNNKPCFYDYEKGILRYPILRDSISDFSPFVEFNESSLVSINAKNLMNSKVQNFGTVRLNEVYDVKIEYKGLIREFKLTFTNLPLVQVIHNNEIVDEPKILGRITINDPKEEIAFSAMMGVDYRGRYSQVYPKKSLGFTLLENEASLLSMKKRNKWILGSFYADPTRIRNLVSFNIWKSLNDLGENKWCEHLGIDSKLIELFVNNEYLGIYVLSDKVDQELFGDSEDRLLYKAIDWSDGGTTFDQYDPISSNDQYWNGWEQEIPDPDKAIAWGELENLYQLIIHEKDNVFRDRIAEEIDLNNFIDYYLFMNLTYAKDNSGKNMFFHKKSTASKFEIIPWDLDGTWGILFHGERVDPIFLLTNGLFDRLYQLNPDNYKKRLKDRWFYLRQNKYSESSLILNFDTHFQQMFSSDIIEKENSIWGQNIILKEEQSYIQSWLTERLAFLDSHFEKWE